MGSRSRFSMSGKSRPWAASRAVYITPVMRTRSPALSDSTSASVSGVVMSLVPSGAVVTIPSQRHLFVAMRVAFDGDGDGKRRDVTRIREDVDAERSRVAAVALGPDAETVGLVEQLLLERVECGIGIRRAQLPEQGPLAEDRGLFERAADADAEDQRRAGIRPRRPHALDDPLLDALDTLRRREHLVLRAILAATALGHHHDLHGGAGHHVEVDDGRRVVAGVHPVERGAHDGRAQVTLFVALAHALIDRLIERPARDVDVPHARYFLSGLILAKSSFARLAISSGRTSSL